MWTSCVYQRCRVSGKSDPDILGTATITGKAMVDTSNILNSDFGDFGVTYETAQWAKDVGKFVEDVGKATVVLVRAAVDAVVDGAKAVIGVLEEHGANFTFIGEAHNDLGNGLADLLTGDFSGALENADKVLGALLDSDNWASIGGAVLSLWDDFGSSTKTNIWPSMIFVPTAVPPAMFFQHQYLDCGLPGSYEFPEPVVIDVTLPKLMPTAPGDPGYPFSMWVSFTHSISLTNGAEMQLYFYVGPGAYLDMQTQCNSATARAAKDYGCALQFQFTQTEYRVCTYELCPL